MEKFCVFCGERPISKAREHVLPQWLLRATGDPKRTIKLEFPYAVDKEDSREIAYAALQFPACSDCNISFADLQGAATVVEKMIRHSALSVYDFDTLLTWLDKVRIGLWLGALYLADSKKRFAEYDKLV